jgi:6-pyruvoyl-tetrahydropterin synthase
VLAVLDHQHLNAAVPEFAAGALPTSENLVAWVGERLAGSLPAGCRLAGLRIEEDDDLAAEWSEDRES